MTDKTTGAAVVTDANQPKLHNQVASRRITDIAVHALLGILAIIWVMPIVWVVLESFQGHRSLPADFLPHRIHLE